MADAMLLEDPTPLLTDTNDPENFRHIINQHQAGNSIADAIIFGREITAMCGHKFIPTRDPDRLPTCQACKAALSAAP